MHEQIFLDKGLSKVLIMTGRSENDRTFGNNEKALNSNKKIFWFFTEELVGYGFKQREEKRD